MTKYTQEHIDFICKHKDLIRREIAEKMNANFGTNIGARTVSAILIKNGHRSKSNGQFVKGQISWNKGKTGYMGANKTSFKKGQTPHNLKPMFSERFDKDGYILIKTEKGYVPKARYLYEKHHARKLGKHEVVIFLDNNKSNFEINNLRAVSWKENGIMSVNKYHALPANLKDIAINIAKVDAKILERKN